MEEVLQELQMPWRVGIRNGDTSTTERQKQKASLPEILIITPESLHILLSTKDHVALFDSLEVIAVDEWHELMGSKRGVQTELAISRIIHCNPRKQPSVWGISATIGNLEEARDVLLHPVLMQNGHSTNGMIVKATLDKDIEIIPIFPDEVETYPWAGHLGIKLAHHVLPILENSRSTLIFINTRGMSEIWYQTLLQIAPDLAGTIALHHGRWKPSYRLALQKAWPGFCKEQEEADMPPEKKAASISCLPIRWNCSRPLPCKMPYKRKKWNPKYLLHSALMCLPNTSAHWQQDRASTRRKFTVRLPKPIATGKCRLRNGKKYCFTSPQVETR